VCYIHVRPALLYHQAQLTAAQETAVKHRAEFEAHTAEAATAHASTLAALQVSVCAHVNYACTSSRASAFMRCLTHAK
jgi:hypothetical protein